MKNKILALLILIVTYSCKSQKSLDFKITYLPNKEYIQSQNQTFENVINYFATEEVLKNLRNKGIKIPTIQKDTSSYIRIFKTEGKIKNRMPLEIKIIKPKKSSNREETVFYGNSINNEIKIDSISSKKYSEKIKKSLISSIEKVFNQLKYPDKKLVIGETFEQSTITSMPISDFKVNIEIVTTYTLKNIRKGIGYFDIQEDFILRSEVKGVDVKVDGKGNGKVEYEINNKYFSKYYSKSEMNINAKIEGFAINLISKSETNQNTELKASR